VLKESHDSPDKGSAFGGGKGGAGGTGGQASETRVDRRFFFHQDILAQIGGEMPKIKKLILKKDLVIPAGTEFKTGPNKREWFEPNFEALLGPHKDSVITVTIGESLFGDVMQEEEILDDLFEIVR
jgi:hypothetical protein